MSHRLLVQQLASYFVQRIFRKIESKISIGTPSTATRAAPKKPWELAAAATATTASTEASSSSALAADTDALKTMSTTAPACALSSDEAPTLPPSMSDPSELVAETEKLRVDDTNECIDENST